MIWGTVKLIQLIGRLRLKYADVWDWNEQWVCYVYRCWMEETGVVKCIDAGSPKWFTSLFPLFSPFRALIYGWYKTPYPVMSHQNVTMSSGWQITVVVKFLDTNTWVKWAFLPNVKGNIQKASLKCLSFIIYLILDYICSPSDAFWVSQCVIWKKQTVIVVAFINLSGLSLFMLVYPICGMH